MKSKLNPAQQSAVDHTTGPLLILAGAGSGKTSTIAHRVVHLLIDKQIPSSQILGLSFTNKAATELKQRVLGMLPSRRLAKGLKITTFHSLCAQLVRSHAELLGFQKNFTILDQNDQVDILRQVLRNIRIDDCRFDPQVLLFEMSWAKNQFLKSNELEDHFFHSKRLSSDYAHAAFASFKPYQDQLKLLNALDFDDLIYYTVKLFEESPEIKDHYNQYFQYLLVDEYQDTNPAQFKILSLLTEKHQNICVVGDDDQSIYAWRGADPSHILGFKKVYPSAQVVILDQNYRSTTTILEAAFHVIEKNKERFSKKLWSDKGAGEAIQERVLEEDRAEAKWVAEEILRRSSEHGKAWKDFAILYRSNSQSRVFEESLRTRSIPYKIVGGLSFLDRKEVKNALAYLKLVLNPKEDASLRRVINWPSRKIGKTSLEKLSDFAFSQELPLFEVLDQASSVAPQAASQCLKFKSAIQLATQSLSECELEPKALSHWVKKFFESLQIKQAIEEESDDPVQASKKWENVEELVHSVGQFPIEDVKTSSEQMGEFLNRMTLDSRDQEENDTSQDQRVTLLTLHGAKGLEFPIVFLVGMEEGFLPHKRTIDGLEDLGEERRLCYVGITRAQQVLILTRARTRIRYGKPIPRSPSRFIQDIPLEYKVLVDESEIQGVSEQGLNYLAQIKASLAQKRSHSG